MPASVQIPPDIKPAKVESKPTGLEVHCTDFTFDITDDHNIYVVHRAILRSTYVVLPLDLAQTAFLRSVITSTPDSCTRVSMIILHLVQCTNEEEYRKILWGSRIQQDPPTVAYEDVMGNDDRGLYKWLSNIVREHYSTFALNYVYRLTTFTFNCVGEVWVFVCHRRSPNT